jgi:hypothetical protein
MSAPISRAAAERDSRDYRDEDRYKVAIKKRPRIAPRALLEVFNPGLQTEALHQTI